MHVLPAFVKLTYPGPPSFYSAAINFLYTLKLGSSCIVHCSYISVSLRKLWEVFEMQSPGSYYTQGIWAGGFIMGT